MVLAYCLGPAFVQNGRRLLGINEVGFLVQNIQRIQPGHCLISPSILDLSNLLSTRAPALSLHAWSRLEIVAAGCQLANGRAVRRASSRLPLSREARHRKNSPSKRPWFEFD